MASDIDGFLFQKCLLQTVVGYSVDNKPTLSVAVEIKCRWVVRFEEIQDLAGNIVMTSAFVLLGRKADYGDILTNSETGEVVRVIWAKEYVGFDGISMGMKLKCVRER